MRVWSIYAKYQILALSQFENMCEKKINIKVNSFTFFSVAVIVTATGASGVLAATADAVDRLCHDFNSHNAIPL